MGTRSTKYGPELSFEDVLLFALALGNEHACRVRLSVVPLSRPVRRHTHVLMVRAYDLRGKLMHHISHEQSYWPGGIARSHCGAFMGLLVQLQGSLIEEDEKAAARPVGLPAGALTPIEEYIMNSSPSSDEGA